MGSTSTITTLHPPDSGEGEEHHISLDTYEPALRQLDDEAAWDPELAAYVKTNIMLFSVRLRPLQWGTVQINGLDGQTTELPAVLIKTVFTFKPDNALKCRFKWAKLDLGFVTTIPNTNPIVASHIPYLQAYAPARIEGPLKEVDVTTGGEYGVTVPFWNSGSLSVQLRHEFKYTSEGRMVIDGVPELTRPVRVAWTFQESRHYLDTGSGMLPSMVEGAVIVACNGEFQSKIALRTDVGYRLLYRRGGRDVQWPLKGYDREPMKFNPAKVLSEVKGQPDALGSVDLKNYVNVSG